MAVEPRLASAVMLLRDTTSGQGIEVFMVRRVIQSDFMPDVYGVCLSRRVSLEG